MTLLRQDTDHAFRILMLLADADRRAYVAVSDLAMSVGASVAFIHKVVQKLRRHGIVAVRRGVRGGVTLAKTPDSISILAIVEAVQGRFAFARCKEGKTPCPNSGCCTLSAGLAPIENQFTALLRKTTLAHLQPKTKSNAQSARLTAAGRGGRRPGR